MLRSSSVALFALVLAACGDDGVSPTAAVHSTIRILPSSAASAEFRLGDTVRLTPARTDAAGTPIANDDARFVWRSGDTTVAVVDADGLVTFVGLGTTTIAARLADAADPGRPSLADTASASIPIGATPEVVHAGPVIAMAMAEPHQCVLLVNGRAECRGLNSSGQLGIGSVSEGTALVDEWTPVAGGLTFSSISTSATHTCAMGTEGRAYCWGGNGNGQLGLGLGVPHVATPTRFGSEYQWASVVAATGDRTCGVTTAGVPMCVGENGDGQTGRAPMVAFDSVIAEWGSDHVAASIHPGYYMTCVRRVDGQVFCSGLWDFLAGRRPTPEAVGPGMLFTRISLGIWHGCGLDAGGLARCWGMATDGNIGNGSINTVRTPAAVSGGQTFASIFAFNYTSCGTTAAGELWCWGRDDDAVMGRLQVPRLPVTNLPANGAPMRVGVGSGIKAVGSAWYYRQTCAIDGASRVVCWGLPDAADATAATRAPGEPAATRHSPLEESV